jgi:hypothetical protein
MRAPNATLGVSTPRLGGSASRSSTSASALSHAQRTVTRFPGSPSASFSSFFASRPAIAYRTPSGACRTKYSAAWRPVNPDAP